MQFSSSVGHAALKAKLIGNVRDGRVPHAQFFLGPRGSGVLPMALGYARYLLCTARGAADACGTCPSCTMVEKLAHPDLHFAFPIYLSEKIKTCHTFLPAWRTMMLAEPYADAEVWRNELQGENKQLRMGVDVAADITRVLSLKSHQGSWKVVLIWLPEFLSPDAANKLLKVLEEPDPNTVFLLVGHADSNLLPTIISRVQLVKVPALGPGEVAEALRRRFPELDDAEARAVAGRSEGDLLEAVAMAANEGNHLFEFFRDWLRACYANNKAAEIAGHVETFGKLGRERQKGFIRYSLQLIRQCVLRWKGVPQLLVVPGEEQAFVERFSALLNVRNAELIRGELEEAHVHLERNANPKVLFADLSYRLGLLLSGRAA